MSQQKELSNSLSTDYIIIGGGIAGVTCCEQLISIHNRQKTHKSIALISAHPLLKAVSKLQKISQHLMDIEVTEYSAEQFLHKHSSKNNKNTNNYINLSIFTGYVIDINPLQKTIKYTKAQSQQTTTISYHKCLIATGGSPKLFRIKNNNQKKHKLIHVLRDSETVENFSHIISSSNCSTIMIVGNGGISMELVYTLLKHNRSNNCKLKIVWVIKHNHIGNTFLDRASAAFLIPALFPDQDPEIHKHRLQNTESYANICVCNDMSAAEMLGGAVGPRWVGNLSQASKQKPLWMDHIALEIADDHKMENENEKKVDSFPNELVLKIQCDVSSIEEFEGDKNDELRLKVMLTNGEVLIVDQLLCAMGVIPNTSFCDSKVFNKTIDNELIVNEYLQTSIKDVYCAGDCCGVQLSDEEEMENNCWFQMKLWSQSQRMGFIVAQAMSARDKDEIENNIHLLFNFELFAHITKFFGKKCVFLGKYNTEKDETLGVNVLMRVKPNEEFIKVVVRNGRVIGAVLIGETELEETFENLILNKTNISCYGDDFLNFNVDLEAMFD